MRLVTLLASATLAGLAAPVLAAPSAVHLTDVQFIEASRCLGLMSSKALGTPDAAAMKAFLRTQDTGREGLVYDQADQARDDAMMEAGRGGDVHRNQLIAERDGVCHSLLVEGGPATTAAAGGPTHTLQ